MPHLSDAKVPFMGFRGPLELTFLPRPLGSLEVSVSIGIRIIYQGTPPHLQRTAISFRIGLFPATLESHARNINAPPVPPDVELTF